MKTQKKNTRTILKLVAGGVALVLAIPFCMGMYAGITSHTGTTGQITKTLKEHCDCKTIEMDMSAYGLQFSRKDGLTGEKAAYTLKDCKTDTDFNTEAARLNAVLNAEVEGYASLDVVQLIFVNDGKREASEIINGKLQTK